MKKPIFWIALVMASTAVALYVTWRENAFRGDLLVEIAPLILGKVVGLVLIPAIVAGVVILLGKLFKRQASDTMIFSAVGWADAGSPTSFTPRIPEHTGGQLQPARRSAFCA